jgi:hypothetical protein
LYLTIEQYLSQSFPYFLEHLVDVDEIKTETGRTADWPLPLEVTSTPVDEDSDKEDAVEIRNRGGGADDSTPEEAHSPVGDVVLCGGKN